MTYRIVHENAPKYLDPRCDKAERKVPKGAARYPLPMAGQLGSMSTCEGKNRKQPFLSIPAVPSFLGNAAALRKKSKR